MSQEPQLVFSMEELFLLEIQAGGFYTLEIELELRSWALVNLATVKVGQ